MNASTSSVSVSSASNVVVSSDVYTPRTTLSANDKEIARKAITALHAVFGPMAKNAAISDDFLSNMSTLGELLGCVHRVMKEEKDREDRALRERFASAVDSAIKVALDKRAALIAKFEAIDPELRGELAPPKPVVSVWVSDLLPAFDKGTTLEAATKALHDAGYMVHVAKFDGRRKEQDNTPPFVTATVGQPIRTHKAK